MVYIFIYLVIILIILSDININIINKENYTKIKLKFLYIISFTINSKTLINYIENVKKKGLKEEIIDIKNGLKYRFVLSSYLKKIKINKLWLIYFEKLDDISINNVFIISSAFKIISKGLKQKLLSVKNENYLIRIKETRDIDLNIKLSINVFDLIYTTLKKIKEIIKIRKDIKEYERK